MVFPVSVLTKICMPPLNLSTRCRVLSFWMLQSATVLPSSRLFPAKMSLCSLAGMPSFSVIRSLILAMLSVCSTSTVMVFPVRVLTNTCIPPRSLRTRWTVLSFWMLQSLRLRSSSSCLPPKMSLCWSMGMPSRAWMSYLRRATLSLPCTSHAMVFPVRVFTKICIYLMFEEDLPGLFNQEPTDDYQLQNFDIRIDQAKIKYQLKGHFNGLEGNNQEEPCIFGRLPEQRANQVIFGLCLIHNLLRSQGSRFKSCALQGNKEYLCLGLYILPVAARPTTEFLQILVSTLMIRCLPSPRYQS